MKLEFLALKWAMSDKFREYLLGHKCIVFTDNNPLSHLSSAKLGALEQHWVAEFMSFNFEICCLARVTQMLTLCLTCIHPEL